MRARIHRPGFRLEFQGSPSVWNELLRPIFGGPEAPPDPVPPPAPDRPAAAPAALGLPAASAPVVRTYVPAMAAPAPSAPSGRTWIPPRSGPAHASAEGGHAEAQPGSRAPWRRRGGPEPEVRVEPSNDPDTLYARLDAMGSRRAEKDAVIAAVWFVGQDQREVHEREIDKHLREHGGPEDVKIRPHLAKHIARTKLLEPGTQPGLVRLSRKGREQVRLLCGV